MFTISYGRHTHMWMHEALTNCFCCSQPSLHFMFRNIFVYLFFKVELLKLIKISNVTSLIVDITVYYWYIFHEKKINDIYDLERTTK